MNCRRARSLLPLAAGSDLPTRLGSRLAAHLERCPACRKELETLRRALEELKTLAREEGRLEWPESEWRAVMQRLGPAKERKRRLSAFVFRRPAWLWQVSLVLVAAAAALWLLLSERPDPEHSSFPPSGQNAAVVGPEEATFPAPVPRAAEAAEEHAFPVSRHPSRPSARPSISNLVFVSGESGLTVHWVFNSEFEWKENIP